MAEGAVGPFTTGASHKELTDGIFYDTYGALVSEFTRRPLVTRGLEVVLADRSRFLLSSRPLLDSVFILRLGGTCRYFNDSRHR